MDKRIAENARNFFLSDRFTFTGADFMPLAEVISSLNAEIAANGNTSHSQDRHTAEQD